MKMFSWIYSPVQVHIQTCLVLWCALQRCLTGISTHGAAAPSLFCQHPAAPGRSVSSSFHRLLLHYHTPPTSSDRGRVFYLPFSVQSWSHRLSEHWIIKKKLIIKNTSLRYLSSTIARFSPKIRSFPHFSSSILLPPSFFSILLHSHN